MHTNKPPRTVYGTLCTVHTVYCLLLIHHQVEEELRARVDRFEAGLRRTSRELESFTKKDPPVLTMDEMRTCVATVDKLRTRAEEADQHLKEINKEEVFLDWDPSR